MKEYRIAKGWALFIYVFAPLLIALFGYLLLSPLFSNSISPTAYWFLAPVSIAMLGLCVVGLLDTMNGKVIMDGKGLHLKSTLSNRSLSFNQIKGYRIDKNYVYVLPMQEGLKQIKISNYTGKVEEITQWLADTYPDVDQLNVEKEQQAILDNYDFGRNTEERTLQLAQAKKYATILNFIGGGTAAWAFFKPEPYEYAILVCIIAPLLAVVAIFWFKGLIRVDERQDSAYPSVALGILFPACALVVRSLLDFNILDYANIWPPASIIAIGLVVVILMGTREFSIKNTRGVITILSLALMLFAYAYGAVVTLNCIYDSSPTETYQAKVIDKHISKGKSTTYYLNLTPWGPQSKEEDVTVTEEMYDRVEPGTAVDIYLQKGLYHIPWFTVEEGL